MSRRNVTKKRIKLFHHLDDVIDVSLTAACVGSCRREGRKQPAGVACQ